MTVSVQNLSAPVNGLGTAFADRLALSGAGQELLLGGARTANTFTDDPVSDEQVKAIYDLAKWAPTSMNNQPLRIMLVRSPEARERLVQTMAGGNRAKTAAAPLVAILAADHTFHENFPITFPHFPGARDMFAADDALRAHTADLNATLQVAYFILAVRAAGLVAGPMTGFDAVALNTEFFPQGERKVLAVVNIGKAGPGAWMARGHAWTTTRSSAPSERGGFHLLRDLRGVTPLRAWTEHCEATLTRPTVIRAHERRWSAE